MFGEGSYIRHVGMQAAFSVKWIAMGLLTGAVVGVCASVFAKAIGFVTGLRLAHPWILFLMPLAGLFIVNLYRFADEATTRGTNMVIEAVRNDDEEPPLLMAPLIFISTVLTHLTGGSAGREGAALQLGGSMGDQIARLLRFSPKDRTRSMMIGMSAAFSALFGTPLAASVMPTEISTVGIIYNSALVPCVIASLTAHIIAGKFGLESEAVDHQLIEAFSVRNVCLTGLLALCCAAAGILFCVAMHKTGHFLAKRIRNEYLRVLAGSAALIALTLLVGSQTYNGTGSAIIDLCKTGRADLETVKPYAFLLKILFTAVTLSCGFKGGEIVPSLFIGATVGNTFGILAGMDPALCACMGMGSVFGAVTNCPITALLISFELFGFDAMPFLLLCISLTYLFSGHYGLYSAQRIRYNKYDPGRIDINTH